jgi:hypothetical protein
MRHGTSLEVKPSRLKNVGHEEGLLLELSGSKHPLEPVKGITQVKQKAIIKMVCNTAKSGWEPSPEPESKLRKREDDDEEGNDPNENLGSSLQILSYKDEAISGDVWGVLRLTWETKYACEEASSIPAPGSSSSWGFFTWMIIM